MTQTTGLHAQHRADEVYRSAVVIALDDRTLPSGLARLRTVVRDAFLDGGARVVVDVAGLQRLSSGTVAALLWANRHCHQRGGLVVLRSPSESNLELLRRTGLGDVLQVETPQVPEQSGLR